MEGEESNMQICRSYRVHVSFEKCKLNPSLKREKNCLKNLISIKFRYWEI
jgi:hypothetical protein